MDALFASAAFTDAAFFVFIGSLLIAVILFRRASRLDIECPKDVNIKEYWGSYAREKECGECKRLNSLRKSILSNPLTKAPDGDTPAAWPSTSR
jgi:hypothetical protein